MTLWTFVETHITNIEMKHDALLKIAVDMHSQFSPIWQIFLPVYHQPSKRASCFISNLENLASTKAHRAIFTSEMLGTFFWCQHRLAIAVESLGRILEPTFSSSSFFSWPLNFFPFSLPFHYRSL